MKLCLTTILVATTVLVCKFKKWTRYRDNGSVEMSVEKFLYKDDNLIRTSSISEHSEQK